jgi:hypothetical protein
MRRRILPSHRATTPSNPGEKGRIHDHKRPPKGWYQLVSGPVAAFWKQRVAMVEADQFSNGCHDYFRPATH